MKESYREGVANHSGPESCADHRKVVSEALTGVQAGQVLSREMERTSGSRRCQARRKATGWKTLTRVPITLRGRRPWTCLETLCARTGRPRQRLLQNGRPEGERDER